MSNRTPTHRQPVPEGVQVVTADQLGQQADGKPEGLAGRVKAKIKDAFDPAADAERLAARDVPTWQPGELAEDADQTLVTGNAAVDSVPDDDQPPANVMRELRKRRAADVEQRVGRAAAKVAGLVELDRWNRLYAVHIHHLASIAGLQAAAVEALQNRDLPTAELRGLFRAELDEWERDIESGGS